MMDIIGDVKSVLVFKSIRRTFTMSECLLYHSHLYFLRKIVCFSHRQNLIFTTFGQQAFFFFVCTTSLLGDFT
jgi:hypothetical protein